MRRITIGIVAVLVSMIAFAAIAVAGKPVTLKNFSGVDHGDGSATYKVQLKGPKKCRKGRKISFEALAAPTHPHRVLGKGKTNGKGKATFAGAAPSETQRIQLKIKTKKGCDTPLVPPPLEYEELFG